MLCPPHPPVLACGPGAAFSRGSVFPGEHTGLSLGGAGPAGAVMHNSSKATPGEGNPGEPKTEPGHRTRKGQRSPRYTPGRKRPPEHGGLPQDAEGTQGCTRQTQGLTS